MSSISSFKHGLSAVTRLWENDDYDAALAKVEELRKSWPGNAHLQVLWADLVQLQEAPTYSLEDAKEALQSAVELDKTSPAAMIELGHFLNAVEDDPKAAAKAYAEAIARARELLLEALIGQAKAFIQLEKKDEALRCVVEVLRLRQAESGAKRNKSTEPDIIVKLPSGRVISAQLHGQFGKEMEELLGEVIANSA